MPDSFLSDPLWYKDAVIYELHVRSFYDSNNDGFGDFQGLREKLPYLDALGVNTLWLLPFLESPLKDDGYDTADYFKVLPIHGDLDDFKAFMEEAHDRGMRVITELVLNHTSDQHPWFQEARNPASDKHDWYVWSETDDKYEDVRIIFTDTEDSNWTWDAKAQKYYWHRFFSHQPDLNFDNPEVRAKMKEVMFFWLDMGVDGLRLDAVPYLYQREGTSSENLPETIEYVKELRAAIEERYGPGKVMLAEANQWPEDTLPYFGEDDDGTSTGVQMAFNFPIMPRLFMALRRENRRPFVEMLERTRDIPNDAQWAIFLRNHDELTLEMVTDEERDYMYNEYAADDRFRINVGIRRRLTPLLEGERKRIELMNAILFSLKGSPVIYYGDEIGMGDDPFLGDRNGVRTPMQWSPDKNGGFSRAPHHKLFMPPINRGEYAFDVVNVEDANNDPHSLLHFMRRLIALRQQHKEVFGRGTLKLLPVDNPSILAFVREHEDTSILVCANLSRYAQPVELPPHSAFADTVPVELFGQSAFPAFEDGSPYPVMLGPHSFYWFKLVSQEELDRRDLSEPEPSETSHMNSNLPVFSVSEGLQNVLIPTMARGQHPERFAEELPEFLQAQRWFGSKSKRIDRVEVEDALRLDTDPVVYLSILRVHSGDSSELFTLPLTTLPGKEGDALLEEHPDAGIIWLNTDTQDEHLLVYDASVTSDFWTTLYRWWSDDRRGRSLQGVYEAERTNALKTARPGTIHLFSGEQSNSSAVVGGRHFVKLYRRLEEGTHPEKELLDHLTKHDFSFTPELHGTIDFRHGNDTYTLGVVQEALPAEVDGWTYALQSSRRFLERVAQTPLPEDATRPPFFGPTHDLHPPVWMENVAPELLSLAEMLGVRTAEMHQTLAEGTSNALKPVPAPDDIGQQLYTRVWDEAEETRSLLQDASAPEVNIDWDALQKQLKSVADLPTSCAHIRLHGDYHLGQILRADGEFYILDFEGEPARSLEERRQRYNALRDVAGMLRSLEYAVLSSWKRYDGDDPHATDWVNALLRWLNVTFLDAYADTADHDDFLMPRESRYLYLWAYLLEKALYEVRYELNNRPSWAWLPLRGLQRLLSTANEAAEAFTNGATADEREASSFSDASSPRS
ncbi:MAG: maltose alpha-D-glucosyltransferase [Longimonas sp.]|uniref:maltose alpha-D-glucosyltransferase n=1 Tax=Longimonas sp. TaxID=2039626 RepID=UPI0033463F93